MMSNFREYLAQQRVCPIRNLLRSSPQEITGAVVRTGTAAEQLTAA